MNPGDTPSVPAFLQRHVLNPDVSYLSLHNNRILGVFASNSIICDCQPVLAVRVPFQDIRFTHHVLTLPFTSTFLALRTLHERSKRRHPPFLRFLHLAALKTSTFSTALFREVGCFTFCLRFLSLNAVFSDGGQSCYAGPRISVAVVCLMWVLLNTSDRMGGATCAMRYVMMDERDDLGLN